MIHLWHNESFGRRLKKDILKHKYIYLMAIPVVAYFIIFHYIPMYGVSMAFQEFSPRKGFFQSDWVGFKWFIEFFESRYFLRTLRNTLAISFLDILIGFPIPIIFALLLNEISNRWFKRCVQTITYMPHFISTVVIASLLLNFFGSDGVITGIFTLFGMEKQNMIGNPSFFWGIYVGSGIWQDFGWGSIIYLAAISGVDPNLYEASILDGAGKWKQIIHITIPSILPTIIVLFILRMGSVLGVGAEKVLLIYSEATWETSDIISTYVYRKGLIDSNYSYSTAVGLFNSVVNLILLITFNKISSKVSDTSLW